MQQPFPAPDDFEDLDDPPVQPAPPQLTPEQAAEQSALEVFPGAEAALESDQWWLAGADEASGDPTTAEPAEPIELFSAPEVPEPTMPEPEQPPVATAPTGSEDATPFPFSATARGTTAPEVEIVEELAQSDNVATEAPQPPDVAATPIEVVPPGVMSRPQNAGRQQREAAGASQREAIMAAAGVQFTPEERDAAAQAAQASSVRPGQSTPPPKPQAKKKRTFTRTVALAFLVIAMSAALLSGGAIASGQGDEVERVASSLAPDVLERWISSQVSSIGNASPGPDVAPPVGDLPQVDSRVFANQIAHTGGAGVAVRSTCVSEARTPRRIPEGTAVTVIGDGVGDCSGWSVVRAAAVVSWVESAYLEPVTP